MIILPFSAVRFAATKAGYKINLFLYMNKKSITVIIIIIIFVALGLGGYWLFKEKSQESRLVSLEDLSGQERFVLEGEIITLSEDDFLELKTIKDGDAPLADMPIETEIKKVALNKNTEILRYTDRIKSREDFLKEQKEFQAQFTAREKEGSSTASLEAPDWRIAENIPPKDLRAGDRVRVYAYQDKNNTYWALKITVDKSAVAVPDAAASAQTGDERAETSGEIQEIRGEFIKIKEIGPTGLSLGIREIKISADTKIIEKTRKTNEEFSKEQADFVKKMANTEEKDTLEAPTWFTVKEINLNALKAGNTLNIFGIKESSGGAVLAETIEYIVR